MFNLLEEGRTIIAIQAGLFRIAHLPARFPSFDERVLHHVLRFLAIFQRAEGDGKKCTAHLPNDHFENFDVAMNGSAIHLMVGGLRWCDQSLDR